MCFMLGLVKQARLIQGMTQFELAVESGISLPTIQNIEAGKANPSIEVLTKIFSALGLNLTFEVPPFDLERAINFGVPLLSKKMNAKGEVTKELLKKECRKWLYHLHESTLTPRESIALISFFMAIKDHWPTFFSEIKSSFLEDLIEKYRKNGQCIKLRRIGIANLSRYL
jgi:transcriptional regulator with XRE-family HTH domain